MDGTNLALAISSLCLILHSTPTRDVLAREVDGEAYTPLVDDTCKPIDKPRSKMTLSILRLESTSLAYSSVVLNSSDIHAQKEKLVGVHNDLRYCTRMTNQIEMTTVYNYYSTGF
jgi:hypothetical protein